MPRFHVVERLGPSQSLTREGYLILHDVPLARTGPQLYSEGEVPIKGDAQGRVIISRDEDEVFRPETIASLNGKAVTMDHPDDDITPENHRDLAVGHVMHPHRGDGVMDNLLLGDLFIWAPEAIEAIRKRQMREVSVGYNADYTDDGNGRGHQQNIIANHLALVDSGRCGPVCRIGDKATYSRDACTCGANTSDDRVSKQDADYVDQASDPNERCGVCKHYQPDGTCDVVEGKINPDGWSRFFEMRQTADAFEEKEHPRGQPGNAGEFAPKGGGGSSESEGKSAPVDRAKSAIRERVSWDNPTPNGRVVLSRGGKTSGVKGPLFFSTNPDLSVTYSDDGERPLETYSFDKKAFLEVGDKDWEKHFGEEYEDLGIELYSDPPREVLDYIKKKGLAGFASPGGEFVRVEDPKAAKMRFDRGYNHIFKDWATTDRDDSARLTVDSKTRDTGARGLARRRRHIHVHL